MKKSIVKRPITVKIENLLKIDSTKFRKELVETVNGRNVWEWLRVATKFNDWIKRRILDGQFEEGVDFVVAKNGGVKNLTTAIGSFVEYHLSLKATLWLIISESKNSLPLFKMILNKKDCEFSQSFFNEVVSFAKQSTDKKVKPVKPVLLIPVNRPKRNIKTQLYVVKFSNGVIKVGKGIKALNRVLSHTKDASIFDVNVVSFFIEENPQIKEDNLIRFCVTHGTLYHGNEYFKNLDYDSVVNFLKGKVERKILPNKTIKSDNIIPILPYRERRMQTV